MIDRRNMQRTHRLGLSLVDASVWKSGKWLLRNVGFELPAGAFVVLAGPNGAGKSTLLRFMSGLLLVQDGWLSSGCCRFQGASTGEPLKVAYLGQALAPSAELTVNEFLSLSGAPPMAALNERFELSELGEIPLHQLSGGQWQRVRLAQCLSHDAALVLLDEPETYLDRRWQTILLDILKERCSLGDIVVVSHHRPQDAVGCASHWLGLRDGELMFFESQTGVFPDSLMNGLFLGKMLDSP